MESLYTVYDASVSIPLQTPTGVPMGVSGPNVWKPHPWSTLITSQKTDAGLTIDESAAMCHSPLWHGLLLLGGDAGSLDLVLKRQRGESTEDDTVHNAYKLASIRPHSLICPNVFWELALIRALLWGNFLAEIERDAGGRPLPVEMGGGLTPLDPQTTGPEYDGEGKLWITTVWRLSDRSSEKRWIDPFDTFHLKNLTSDGFWGKGLLDIGKERIANGLGILKQHNRFMGNGMQPDWLLSYPTVLDPEDRVAIQDQLNVENAGLENTGRRLVLDHDVRATQLGMDFRAAQMAELASLDVKSVASLLGVPAVMLNAMDQMTFNNVEESEKHYINRTLRRWLVKIQEELHVKMLTPIERTRLHFEHNLDPLLQGRLSERYAAYSQAIASLWLSRNEVRAMEGLNPEEGLDEFVNPNTTSFASDNEKGAEGEQEEEPEEGRTQPENEERMAAKLKNIFRREDAKVARACKTEENIVSWLGEYYGNGLLAELSEVAPKSAKGYCEDRLEIWLKCCDHVRRPSQLGGIVRALGKARHERVASVLNKECLYA